MSVNAIIDPKFMRDDNDFGVIHAQFYVNGNTAKY